MCFIGKGSAGPGSGWHTNLVEPLDDGHDVEEDDDSLFLAQFLLFDDVMLQDYQIRRLLSGQEMANIAATSVLLFLIV